MGTNHSTVGKHKFLNGKSFNLGFSLLELCTVICILAIGIGLAIPSYKNFLMRLEREIVFDHLKSAIEYARQEALIRQKTITVCPHPYHTDSKDWSEGFWVLETRPTHPSTSSPQILKAFPPLQYGRLYFEQFGQHLHIEANGRTINAGIFIYCPNNKERREAEALVINLLARTYRLKQRNSQGILMKNPGTPQEAPLLCR